MNGLARSPAIVACVAFAASCALLLLIELLWPHGTAVQAQGRQLSPYQAAEAPGGRAIDAEARAQISNRPVFSRTRRPQPIEPAVDPSIAAAAPAEPAGPPPLPRLEAYRVVGLIIAGPQSLALIERPGGGQAMRMSPGDGLDGWIVDAVTPEGVVFVGQGERLVLAIPRGDAARQAANAVTP